MVRPAAPKTRAEDAHPDADHEERRNEIEPRIEPFGDDQLGEPERDEPQAEDPSRVGHGDREAEEQSVARSPARADEIRGDHRLPVTGAERVCGTPERGDQERNQNDADAQVASLDQRLEGATRVLGRGRPGEGRRHSRRVPRHELCARCLHVQRRAQEVLWVCEELVARALGGDVGRDEPGAVPSGDDDFLPAHSLGEVRVVKDNAFGRRPDRPRGRRPRTAASGALPPPAAESPRDPASRDERAARRARDRGLPRLRRESRPRGRGRLPAPSGSRRGRERSARTRRARRARPKRSG